VQFAARARLAKLDRQAIELAPLHPLRISTTPAP